MVNSNYNRNGKSFSRSTSISPSNSWPWCCCGCHLSSDRTFRNLHYTVSRSGPTEGGNATYMAANSDCSLDYGHICLGLVRSRPKEKLVKSSSWHRVGNIRSGACPSYWWLVDSQQGEEKGKDIQIAESNGRSFLEHL